MDKINMTTIAEECGTTSNAQIVIIDDIKRAYDVSSPKQMLVEGFIFGVILQGNARILVDNTEYDLKRGDIFGCNPSNILERSMLSMDLQMVGFFITPEYVAELLKNVPIEWSFLMMANTHEILHAQDDEIDRLVAYTELLRMKLSSPVSRFHHESINLLIQSMGLEIFDIRSRKSNELRERNYSPGENLVQRFVMMLTESTQHGKPFLNVNGYAEQLNVSAKYFSQVCKNILGKTASEIINEAIIATASNLLTDNSLSIKQISDRLGFANQSHFGTFFSRKTGTSPQHFRSSK